MYKINEPTPEIRAWHERWARNRAFVDGEAAVKAAGELYLPKARLDDSPAEYEAHLKRTGFFPAAFKIAQGWMGLIWRKPALLNSVSTRIKLLSSVATKDGRSLDDVAQWIVRETMITNFTGVLSDHPSRRSFPNNMSAADELRLGFRPFVARYIGENILEVTRGVIDETRVGLVRVRLLEENGDRVRELLINAAGHYEVRFHDRDGEAFIQTSSVVPTLDGQPLTEIPFDLINTDDSLVPTPSLLQHSVDLNLQHYIAEGALASAINLTTAPISIITGYEAEVDPETKEAKPFDFDVSPGAIWAFGAPKGDGATGVKVEWFTYDPKGQELVTNKLRDLKDALSAIGHSILAPEKPAPEAAETQLIRRAAENAMLAAFTDKTSKRIETAFRRWALWADPKSPDLAYNLNLDFLPQQIPAQNVAVYSTLVDKRQLSLRTLHEMLDEGELMPRNFSPEDEAERIESENIDRPPVDGL